MPKPSRLLLCQTLLSQYRKKLDFLESDFPSHERHVSEFADTAVSVQQLLLRYVYKQGSLPVTIKYMLATQKL